MTDFETHPVGTAARIEQLEAALTRATQNNDMMFVKGMRHGQQVMKDTRRLVIVDSPELVELREALTRANAATAAAYEVAAREVECGCGAGPCQDTTNCSAEDAAAIRALATPDQTAALDKLIAEAEARVWEKAAAIAYDYTPEKHSGATLASHVTGRSIEAAILALIGEKK